MVTSCTEHQCGDIHCVNCHGMFPSDHICFVQNIPIDGSWEANDDEDEVEDILGFAEDDEKVETDKEVTNTKFLFFDFECMFVESEPVPNFCIAQWRCERCLECEKKGVPRDESCVMLDPDVIEEESKKKNKNKGKVVDEFAYPT